jgi:hypothetical protein
VKALQSGVLIVVALGDYFSVPSFSGDVSESLATQLIPDDVEVAHLPMLSADTRDALIRISYVGKAVMKDIYVKAEE